VASSIRPRILFLDEPTLGLDIQTRREIWRYINKLRAAHKMTIFLTTHYMDEADALCDRIAIIDKGAIVVLDTPAGLKSSLGSEIIEFKLSMGGRNDIAGALELIRRLPCVKKIKRDRTSEFSAQ